MCWPACCLAPEYCLPAKSLGTARPSTYEQLKESEEFAFVVTDIESSTELSQQDPIAFQQVGIDAFQRA